MRDVMDAKQAFEKCEALFEQYGVSEEDQGWFILAFESLCIQALIMKGGPFYERYVTALADRALEDAEVEDMIRQQQEESDRIDAEIEAVLQRRERPSMTDAVTRQERWELKLSDVDAFRDTLGKPVDRGIRETVAILQLLGLHTRQSCEGHVDRGLPAPWVWLHVPEAEKLREQIIPLENWLEVLKEDAEAFDRVCRERNRLRQQEEQCEAQVWMLLFRWLEAYYQHQSAVPYEERIVLHSNGRLTVQGALLQGARDTATQALKLHAYQAEMRRFTRFLKRQFMRHKF